MISFVEVFLLICTQTAWKPMYIAPPTPHPPPNQPTNKHKQNNTTKKNNKKKKKMKKILLIFYPLDQDTIIYFQNQNKEWMQT